MVFKLLTCLVQVKNKNFKFLLTAMETLIKFKNCSENRKKFLFHLSFSLIGKFYSVYIHGRLAEQFQDHGKLAEQASIGKPEQTP
jgi:hypothetical protein